mgnify:CR=1 FL=1
MALIKLNTRSIPDDAVTPAKVSVKHLGRRNLLINGAMQIWQRGTSFTTSNTYTADRWLTDTAGAHARSTDTPDSFDYSIKLNPSSGNAVLRQAIELSAAGEGGIFQSGQQFTLSFWLKSSAGGEGINVFIASGTEVAGATTQMASAIGIATTTTGWVKYTYTFTQSVAVGSNDTCYNIVPYVVAPSGDIYITGLQFETGSVATDFEHRLIGEELTLCQRYYQKTATASGVVSTSAIVYLAVQLMTEMRAVPSWSLSGAMMINDVGVNATQSSANITAYNSTTSGTFANLGNFSGLTPYRGCLTRQAGGSYLIADAEF